MLLQIYYETMLDSFRRNSILRATFAQYKSLI